MAECRAGWLTKWKNEMKRNAWFDDCYAFLAHISSIVSKPSHPSPSLRFAITGAFWILLLRPASQPTYLLCVSNVYAAYETNLLPGYDDDDVHFVDEHDADVHDGGIHFSSIEQQQQQQTIITPVVVVSCTISICVVALCTAARLWMTIIQSICFSWVASFILFYS